MRSWTANFDGGIRGGNPGGLPSYGVTISDNTGTVLELSGVLPSAHPTNNVAEFEALRLLLSNAWVLRDEWDEIIVCGDSQLVVNQLTGKYCVNSPHLIPIHSKCTYLLSLLENANKKVEIKWDKREKNERADELAHNAYKRYHDSSIA